MTYLELVNQTLRRLREDEVSSVTDTDYSKLIGIFVNDAIRHVSSAWDWTVLRETFPITTVAGTSTYSLTDFGTRSKILYVHDETGNRVIPQESLKRIRELALGTDNARGTVQYFTVDGVDGNNDARIRLYQTPDDSHNLNVYLVKRNTELTNDIDETLLPSEVITQFAFGYALRERGETGGQTAGEQFVIANGDMANAIALDANLSPDETIWGTV